MEEIRCKKCNKLLGKIGAGHRHGLTEYGDVGNIKKYIPKIEDGNITVDYEIKCPRCGEMNTNK
jgi:phage FluMu protein Com